VVLREIGFLSSKNCQLIQILRQCRG